MLTYRLVRSSRRTLALEISAEGELIARAPRRLPREAVDRFVASKEGWIKKHLAKPRCQLPEPSPEEAAKLKQEAQAIRPGLVARLRSSSGQAQLCKNHQRQKALWQLQHQGRPVLFPGG